MEVYVLNYLSIPLYAKVFKRRNFCIVASLQLFLILALRADTLGVDLQTYASAFEYISHLDTLNVISRVRLLKDAVLPYPFSLESGWMLLNWLVSSFGFRFHTLLVICAAINTYAYGKLVYRYSNIPWMSYCILLAMNTYIYMFGILRQSLAMSIVILAVMAYADGKKVRTFLLWVLAFSIHRTALVAVAFFYVMKKNPISKKIFMWFIVGWFPFVAVAPFVYQTVITKIMSLLGKGYQGTGLQWNYLMVLLILIGILTLMLYSFENLEDNINILSIWSIIFSIYWETFGMLNENLARSVQFFIVFISLAVPQVVNNYFDKKVVRLGKVTISVLLFLYMIVTLKDSPIVPYKVF